MRRRTARLLLPILFFGAILYGVSYGPSASQSAGKNNLLRKLRLPRLPGSWKDPWEKPDPATPAPPPLPDWLRPIEDKLVQPETREWRYVVVHHSAGPSGNAAE